MSVMAIKKPSDDLPLADVLRAANDLVAAKLIQEWALGGALAAIYYVPAIHARLELQGWQVEREHLLIRGFPVQFLDAHGLTEEAVREAERIDYEGVPARVFRAEHIVAIAAGVGRAKDKVRIEQLLTRPISIMRIWKTCCDGIN